MNLPHIHLRAYHTGMFYAWQKYFEHVENITISQGDILRETADAIVSPANSFGYMGGGIDLVYSMHLAGTWKNACGHVLLKNTAVNCQ